jgi:hypothetical protein
MSPGPATNAKEIRMARKARIPQFQQGYDLAMKQARLALAMTIDVYPRPLSDETIEQLACGDLCQELRTALDRFGRRVIDERLLDGRRKGTRAINE